MNTIGGTHNYVAAYRLSFPTSRRAVYGSTSLLPVGVYALSGYITFGGISQGTYGFINLQVTPTTIAEGADPNREPDQTVFYGTTYFPGPGNGSAAVFASDVYVLTSSACLGLQAYITSGSNTGQGYAKFVVIRIG